MPGKLFVKSIACAGNTLTLELSVGEPVVLDNLVKRRDLPGGLTEHAAAVSRGDDHFNVRTVVDAEGNITRVIASASSIPDDWYTAPDVSEA